MSHKGGGWHRQHGAYPSRSDVPSVRSTGPITAPKESWWAKPAISRDEFDQAARDRFAKPTSQTSPK